MKNSYKAILLAALGLTVATAAQAQYTAGDLYAGFTTASGNDVIIDLGSESSLTSGETWTAAQIGITAGTAYTWGVIGDVNTGTKAYYTTVAVGSTPGPVVGATKGNALNNAMGTLEGNFASAPSAGSTTTVAASASTSWNLQATPNATLATSYINEYENPSVTGSGISDALFSVPNSSTLSPTLLGDFTLGSNGSLTFTAVPEPTTYGLMAGAGLLLVSLRSKFSRKQA